MPSFHIVIGVRLWRQMGDTEEIITTIKSTKSCMEALIFLGF